MRRTYLAIDLGAESGRSILGRLEDGTLSTEEVHRFPNEPVRLGDTLHWDFPRLYLEVLEGIRRAGAANGGRLDGISVDTWGVDFGLVDASGGLLALPVHYRDARTRGALDDVFRATPREDIFDITGLQFLEMNTLVQLAALRKRFPEILHVAHRMLPMADLFHFFLSGRAAAELTLASTTQLLDARERDWSRRILVEQGIPPSVMPEIVPPATVLDPLRDDLVEETGLADAPPVIAGASHDTACAVAATPATGEGGWAYVSSGTWSLVGVELEAPVLSREVLGHDFTNEAGVFGTTRFLRNVPGLWLVQECRRQWAREGEELSYDRLAELAEAAPPAQAWLDLSDPAFFEPGDMPAKIRRHCEATGQKPPATRGDLVRCALESLARAWLESIRSAERLTGERVDRVHIVGGGSRLRLLARLAANLIGVPVVAGPAEATATGNLLLQAAARGDLPDLAALREVSRQSADVATFRPRERGPR